MTLRHQFASPLLVFILTMAMHFNKVWASTITMNLKRPLVMRNSIPPSLQTTAPRATIALNTSQSSSIKVVTDIDDTVKSSGGKRFFGIALGGIDTHYQRGQFYPGVFQFYFELSKCNSIGKKPSKVAVLTARAREFLFALALKPADKLCSAFRRVGVENGILDWGIGVESDVYYGSVVEWILQNRKGIRKFINFETMLQNDALLGRKENYVLIGDTGEKDEEAGERIARMYPKRIKAIFLHTVSSNRDRSKLVLPKDRMINGVPILYFRTYVGAAMKAKALGLIGQDSVKRIVTQSRKDLSSTEPKYMNPQSGISSSRWLELEEDIASALKLVRAPR